MTRELEAELCSLTRDQLKERWPHATDKVIDDFLSGAWRPPISTDSPDEPGEDDGEKYCPDCDSWYNRDYGECPYCDGEDDDSDDGSPIEDNYGDESGVEYYRPDYDDGSDDPALPVW